MQQTVGPCCSSRACAAPVGIKTAGRTRSGDRGGRADRQLNDCTYHSPCQPEPTRCSRCAIVVQAAIERMGERLPLSFLLQHKHLALAERVVLRGMCRALAAHHKRVVRCSFARWVKRTLTLRVLAQHELHERLTRQAALAHACAIVQGKVRLRMLVFANRWRSVTLQLRAIEHNTNARVLQRYWKWYSLLTKFQSLVRACRERHRNDAATKIQCIARTYIAKRRWRELVAERRLKNAAQCLQTAYRDYKIRKMAWNERRHLAAIELERVWRGFRGRESAKHRRECCECAAQYAVEVLWLPRAIVGIVYQRSAATKIQSWFRVLCIRRRVAMGVAMSHRRRRYFPALRIQRMWKMCRFAHIQRVSNALVDLVVARCELAAKLIQRSFARYIFKKKMASACTLTTLFRRFLGKKVMFREQQQWLETWNALFLDRWRIGVDQVNPASVWTSRLAAYSDKLHRVRTDQRSALRRLQTLSILRLMIELTSFRKDFEFQHALQIQRTWRWHRLLKLISVLKAATLLLQRALPSLLCIYKQRRRRQCVLGRWRLERYRYLRDTFACWKAEHQLITQRRMLEQANARVRRARWFRHLKLRKLMIRNWQQYVQIRRAKARQAAFARVWSQKHLVRRVWSAWVREAMSPLVVENVVNDQILKLQYWRALQQNRVNRLKTKAAIAWHRRQTQKTAWKHWRADVDAFRELNRKAVAFHQRESTKTALTAWHRHTQAMQRGASHSYKMQLDSRLI